MDSFYQDVDQIRKNEKSPEFWWKVFVIIVLILLVLFLILNGVNVVPNRDYSRLTGPITEKNVVEGQAIQLYPGGGLTSKDIENPSSSSATNGLMLSTIPARSIMANNHATTAGVPTSVILPTNSIMVSNSDGLSALTANVPNRVLTFDGNSIVWGPIVDHLPGLPIGQIFIGNENNEAIARPISGDITMNSGGSTALVADAITNEKIADSNITAAKFVNGEDGQVLTSLSNASVWTYPQNDIMADKTPRQSGDFTTEPVVLHTYSLGDAISLNGQSVTVEAFGNSISNGTSVTLGIRVRDTGGGGQSVNHVIDPPITPSNFEWKLTATATRLETTSGTVTLILYEGTNTHYNFSQITGVSWDNGIFVDIICIQNGSPTITDAITCRYSSANVIRPATIS